jgi:hypothetical protein
MAVWPRTARLLLILVTIIVSCMLHLSSGLLQVFQVVRGLTTPRNVKNEAKIMALNKPMG